MHLVLPLIALLLGARAPARADLGWRDVACAGGHYRYLLYSPGRHWAVPAVVLLNGAGGAPEPMIAAWRDLAQREGIALLAPELPMVASFETVAPAVFRCEVEDAGHVIPLDRSRIYVFGYSMGGYLAYDAGMLESRFFAAIAVCAMAIAPEYERIVDSAARHTPVAIYIGDRDPLVSLQRVARTRDLLQARGFPVHYVELPGHDHDYFAATDFINADAWAFLRRQALPPPGP